MNEINWEELYKSAKDAIASLEKKIIILEGMNTVLEEEKKQWIVEKINQENVIKQHLGNNDGVIGQLQDEIRSLKKRYNIKD